MRTLVDGSDSIGKIWKQVIKTDVSYRMIRYSILAENDEKHLLLNTVSGELIELSQRELEVIRKLPLFYHQEMNDLIEHYFLVPVSFDDAKNVDQLRNIIKKIKSTSDISSYTILPTSGCNARCYYCYESNVPHYNMSEDIANKVIDFIFSHCGKDNNVKLHWFGGEPTLGEKQIDHICEGLADKGIQYESTMISNGYLFSDKMVIKAKEKWKLKSIQITLDGTEETYNRSKSYVNVKDNPFQRVMRNINLLQKENIRVSVRMNLGLHNADDLKSLIDILAEKFSGNKYFYAYVHELFNDQGFTPVRHTLNDIRTLEDNKRILNNYIDSKGCNCSGVFRVTKKYPSLKLYYCMADNEHSLLINPLGQFGKCEHFFYSQDMGDVIQGVDYMSSNAVKWLHPEFAEECKDCTLYPECGQMISCETKSICYSTQAIDYKVNLIKAKMLQE